MEPHSNFFTDVQATNFPWTESPFFEQLVKNARLTPEMERMVRAYSSDGYYIFDPEVPEHVLDGAIQDLDGKYDGRILDAWPNSKHVRNIATAPKVLEYLSLLYQRVPIPFQTLNFNIGTEQATHCDVVHFHSVPERFMCGVWIALEDVDQDNGPLHYYPGSHKLPVIEPHHLRISASFQSGPYEEYSRYVEFLKALIEAHQLKKVDVNMKKGQALIWAANLLHGGSPILNRSRSRHSQVTHYYFSECIYYTPLLSDLPIGRVRPRNIISISTGDVASQLYNGARVLNPGDWPPLL